MNFWKLGLMALVAMTIGCAGSDSDDTDMSDTDSTYEGARVRGSDMGWRYNGK
jgi:hypothetical protein